MYIIEIKDNGNAVAPELKLWLKYKKSLIIAMMADNIKTDVNMYLQTKNFSLPCDTKRIILTFIYDIEDKDIEHWQIKKLNNVLFFNKLEICEGIQKAQIEHKVIEVCIIFVYVQSCIHFHRIINFYSTLS